MFQCTLWEKDGELGLRRCFPQPSEGTWHYLSLLDFTKMDHPNMSVCLSLSLSAPVEPGKFDLVYQNADGSESVEYAVSRGSRVRPKILLLCSVISETLPTCSNPAAQFIII